MVEWETEQQARLNEAVLSIEWDPSEPQEAFIDAQERFVALIGGYG